MKAKCILAVLIANLAMTSVAQAQQGRWATPENDAVAKQMAAQEKIWADGNCTAQPTIKDFIADDFQATSTTGSRYGKSEAIKFDEKNADKDCKFGAVKVQFFGDNFAVAYGDESSLRQDKSGNYTRRCLAWTDTWLKRNGKWEIVAAQDNVVECKPELK